jgi:hypothetical protein
VQSAVSLIESNEFGITMMEREGAGGIGSDDEDATRKLALPRGCEEKEEKE